MNEGSKYVKEHRGFTSKYMNLLLKKMVEHECKIEAVQKGIISV